MRPFSTRALVVTAAAALLVLSGCAAISSRNFVLVQNGYVAAPQKDGSLVASFRGYPGLSLNSVRVNLLYHSAQQALLSGHRYLRVTDLMTESHSRSRSIPVATPKARAGFAESAIDLEPHSSIVLQTSFEAKGVVELYETPPDDGDVLDALDLLDKLRHGVAPQLVLRVEEPSQPGDYVEF